MPFSLFSLRPAVAGPLIALLGFASYALHDVLVRILGETYHVAQVMFFMGLFSFPMVVVMLMRDPRPGTLRAAHPWLASLRAVSAVAAAGFGFYAFTVLPLATVYAMLFATPLLITLLSIPVLGERVGLHRGAAIVLGLVGVLVVLRPGAEPVTLGHLAGIGSALAASINGVIVRKISRDERAEVMVLMPMMAMVLATGAVMPWVYVPPALDDLAVMMVVATLGFLGMLCTVNAYRLAAAATVAPMQYSQMLWAVFYGAVLFGESLTIWTFVGAAMIIGSGLYILFRESQRDVSATQPVLGNRGRLGPVTTPITVPAGEGGDDATRTKAG